MFNCSITLNKIGMPQTTEYSDIIITQRENMSSVLIHKKESENFQNNSKLLDKTENYISKKTPKVKRKNISYHESFFNKLIRKAPYPNFRFFCPFCASVDVFITFDKTSDDFSVDCLDCKKRWIDSRSWKN